MRSREVRDNLNYVVPDHRRIHSQSMKEMPAQVEFKLQNQIQNQKPSQIDFLERKLLELQDKKKIFESDYSRLPITANRSMQYEKKKCYLEGELDAVDKDITAVKRKLKDLKKSGTKF